MAKKDSNVLLIISLIILFIYLVYFMLIYFAVRPNNWFNINNINKNNHNLSRWEHTPKQWSKEVREIMNLHPRVEIQENNRVYEVGCGTGAFLMEIKKLANVNVNVEGNDINLDALTLCRKSFPKHSFYHSDLNELNLETESYDVILGNGVLGYMTSLDAVKETLKKCGDMLKKGKTMRFTLVDPPITLTKFLTFQCSISSQKTRIPDSLFYEFGRENGFEVHIYYGNLMHGQKGRRYIAVLRKL